MESTCSAGPAGGKVVAHNDSENTQPGMGSKNGRKGTDLGRRALGQGGFQPFGKPLGLRLVAEMVDGKTDVRSSAGRSVRGYHFLQPGNCPDG